MQTALIIDTEVASLKHREVIQMAWQQVPVDNDYRYQGDIDMLFFQPSHEWEMGAIATHLITPREVEINATDSSINAFRYLPKTEYVIGHNIDFDADALGGMPGVKRICTLAMARFAFPDFDSHKLTALYLAFYGVSVETVKAIKSAHNALIDVWLCCQILHHVSGVQIGESDDWAERMWLISEQARIPRVMAVGKHKGELIKDLPADYKRWFLNRDDLDPYLRKALEQ